MTGTEHWHCRFWFNKFLIYQTDFTEEQIH